MADARVQNGFRERLADPQRVDLDQASQFGGRLEFLRRPGQRLAPDFPKGRREGPARREGFILLPGARLVRIAAPADLAHAFITKPDHDGLRPEGYRHKQRACTLASGRERNQIACQRMGVKHD